jgi:hypothetical protein
MDLMKATKQLEVTRNHLLFLKENMNSSVFFH